MDSLSIIIPVYNEENRILSSIYKIKNYFSNHHIEYEVIIVDDGSKDNTLKVIKNLKDNKITCLRNKQNMGKGYCIRKGFLLAKNKYVLFSDADLSTPISEVSTFLKYCKLNDIVIGSRKLLTSNIVVKQPFYRVLVGNIFPILVNLIVINRFKDTQCGFKLFKKKTTLKIFKKLRINGFSFDVEILYLANKFNLKTKELGVKWVNDPNSRLKLFKHTVPMLFDLFKIKIFDFLGYYSL